jgi:hypothetical protein
VKPTPKPARAPYPLIPTIISLVAEDNAISYDHSFEVKRTRERSHGIRYKNAPKSTAHVCVKICFVFVVRAAENCGRHMVEGSSEQSISADGSGVRIVLPNLALYSPKNSII